MNELSQAMLFMWLGGFCIGGSSVGLVCYELGYRQGYRGRR